MSAEGVLLDVGCQPLFICTCGIKPYQDIIHVAGCLLHRGSWAATLEKPIEKSKGLVSPAGVPLRQRHSPDVPAYKFLLQFNFTRPIRIDMWKKIKAPAGWRKNPTSRDLQHKFRGVRFQCTNLTHALTPDDIHQLHTRLMFILEEVF